MITMTFLANFALGFVLAVEFGQVSVEIFRRGVSYGFRQAALVSAGATFADFIYLNITITGIILVLNRPGILRFLWIIGGLVLVYIAARGLTNRSSSKMVEGGHEINSFFSGFLLNFIHPLNLIYWITILNSIVVNDLRNHSTLTTYLNGTGIFWGVLAWDLILSALAATAKRWLNLRTLQIFSKVSSLFLLGFAGWFFYNALV